MTDLEMTVACAEAMGFNSATPYSGQLYVARDGEGVRVFDPLHDDAQCFALVKKFGLNSYRLKNHPNVPRNWWVVSSGFGKNGDGTDLNRAIVQCVAALARSRTTSGGKE